MGNKINNSPPSYREGSRPSNVNSGTPYSDVLLHEDIVDVKGTGAADGAVKLNYVGTFYKNTGDIHASGYTNPSRLVLHGSYPMTKTIVVDAVNAAVGSGNTFTLTIGWHGSSNTDVLTVTAGANANATAEAIRTAIEADAVWHAYIHCWVAPASLSTVHFIIREDRFRNMTIASNDVKVVSNLSGYYETGGVQLLGNYLFDTEFQFSQPPQGRQDVVIQGAAFRPPQWRGYGVTYANRDTRRHWPEIISDGVPRLKVLCLDHDMIDTESAGVKYKAQTVQEWVAAKGTSFGEDFDNTKVQFIRDIWMQSKTPWTNGASNISWHISVGRKGSNPTAGGTYAQHSAHYDLMEPACVGAIDSGGNQLVAAKQIHGSDADGQFGDFLHPFVGGTALTQSTNSGPSASGSQVFQGVVSGSFAATNTYATWGVALATASGTPCPGIMVPRTSRLVGFTVKYMGADEFAAASGSNSISFEVGYIPLASAPTTANFTSIDYFGAAPYSTNQGIKATFSNTHDNTYPQVSLDYTSELSAGGVGMMGRPPIVQGGTLLAVRSTKVGSPQDKSGNTDADFVVSLILEPVCAKGSSLREGATPWLNLTDGGTGLAYHNAEMEITFEGYDAATGRVGSPPDINTVTAGETWIYVLYDELTPATAYSTAFLTADADTGGR